MTLLKYIKSTGLIISMSFAATSCREGRMDFIRSAQIPLVKEEARQDEKAEDSDEANNAVAAEPVAIGGAYLFDCAWLAEAESKAIGIGSCRFKDPVIAASAKVEGVEMVTEDSSIQAHRLPASALDIILFEVSHQVYGQTTSVAITLTHEGKTIRMEGMQLKDLPSTPPVSFALNTFKLGDDGPTGSALCTGLQTRAATNGFYGTVAQMTFEVSSATSDVKISLSRICGNGAGTGGSLQLAQIEIRRAADNSLVSSAFLPASSLGNDMADGADPTASYTSVTSMAKGQYTVQIIVGRANATALDDLVIDRFEISGANLLMNSRVVK